MLKIRSFFYVFFKEDVDPTRIQRNKGSCRILYFNNLISDAVSSAINKSAGTVKMSSISVIGDVGVPVRDDEIVAAASVRAEALSAIHDAVLYAVRLVVLVHAPV